MKKISAVFSDIDGTILRNDSTPSPRTVNAIRRLREQGIWFVLVSARPPHAIRPIAAALGAPDMPLVAYAGGLLLDEADRVLAQVGISPSRAQAIAARCQAIAPDTSVSVYEGMNWYTDTPQHEGILFERQVTGLRPTAHTLADLSDLSVVHKMLCIGPAPSIDRLEEALCHEPDWNVSKSKATFLELQPKQASKSQAIRVFCDHYGIDLAETVAFGDYYNDIDLLQAAGLGVAMANAPQEVRQAADVVTLSNQDDGVAAFLEQLWEDA